MSGESLRQVDKHCSNGANFTSTFFSSTLTL
jgi:hypothetical protein